MTVLLWNTGERLCSGPWSPRRIPPPFFSTTLPAAAHCLDLLRQLGWKCCTPSALFLFVQNLYSRKINHPGTKIPESRRRSHTCVNFLHHEAQDFAFWKAACFGLSPAFGLLDLLASVREAELFRFRCSDAFSDCQQMDK